LTIVKFYKHFSTQKRKGASEVLTKPEKLGILIKNDRIWREDQCVIFLAEFYGTMEGVFFVLPFCPGRKVTGILIS